MYNENHPIDIKNLDVSKKFEDPNSETWNLTRDKVINLKDNN